MSNIDGRLAPWFARQHGAISRIQALSAGATRAAVRSRLDRGIWEESLPGVYVLRGVPPSWRQRLMAACLWSGGHASHRAAAALLKLPGFTEGIVEITTAASLEARGIVVHRSREMVRPWITSLEDIPVTTAPRTIVDLCAVTRPHRVEASLDNLLTRRIITPAQQWASMNRMGTRGRCGTAALRSLVAERMDLGAHPESVAETRFARILLDSSLPRPPLQFKVEDGDFRARLDAAWPEAMLGVEIDGWQWHSSKSARLKDARRQNYLERLGWTILRFYWEDVVSDPGYVLSEITSTYYSPGPSIAAEWS